MKGFRKFFAAAGAMFLIAGCGDKPQRMPVYVLPWYNSKPFDIQVGRFSDDLKSDDPQQLLGTAEKIRSQIGSMPVEALYVLAIRLYDVGEKDEAVYWFYTAQFRRNLFARMVLSDDGVGNPAFECEKAQTAFNKLSGKWINGYAGGAADKWLETLSRVIDEGPRGGYIGTAYPDLTFRPEPEQAAVAHGIARELAALRQYIMDNREEMARARKENGIEGKY